MESLSFWWGFSREFREEKKSRKKMFGNKRLPFLDALSIESCSCCQNTSDSERERSGGDGGGWEEPLSAAPIRRITVTRADVSLAANNTGGRGRRVTLPFVSRAASCVTLAAPWLTAELQAVTGERLRLRAFKLREAPQASRLFPLNCSCAASDVQNWSGAWCCVMLQRPVTSCASPMVTPNRQVLTLTSDIAWFFQRKHLFLWKLQTAC